MVAFRTEKHKGKLGKRKIKEFEKEAGIIDMYIKGDKSAAIAKALRIIAEMMYKTVLYSRDIERPLSRKSYSHYMRG